MCIIDAASVKGSDVCILHLACDNGHVGFAKYLIAEKLYDVNGEFVLVWRPFHITVTDVTM